MNDSQLRRLLAERSPWRARAGWEADDPDLRAAGRLSLDYEPEPLADIHAPGLYVLRGPRRVGKSLELKRTVARLLAARRRPEDRLLLLLRRALKAGPAAPGGAGAQRHPHAARPPLLAARRGDGRAGLV